TARVGTAEHLRAVTGCEYSVDLSRLIRDPRAVEVDFVELEGAEVDVEELRSGSRERGRDAAGNGNRMQDSFATPFAAARLVGNNRECNEYGCQPSHDAHAPYYQGRPVAHCRTGTIR